ncbi:unnamed protein product, partial [Penicillium salamii]
MLNAYPITAFPTKEVYQYEINVLHGTTNETDRRVLRKCWNSDIRKERIPDGIWDGGRICWSLRQFNGWNEEVIFKSDMARDLKTVDLKKNPTLRMSVMPKRKVQLSKISDWLATGSTLDETVIEALSFLDHLLREWPTQQFVAIKRAFFFDHLDDNPKLQDDFHRPLANFGASVYRGIYQAIRPTP